MVKTFIGGIAVGIANVIPGVSGGTMMVILGIFNRVMDAISGVFKKDNEQRLSDIVFLLQVLFGAAVGLVGFAKVLEFLFNNYPTQTIYWFIGLIVCSIPLFLKGEMKGESISIFPFIIGLAVVFSLEFFNPGKSNVVVNPSIPAVDLALLIKMVLIGIIAGATMLMPGVSGSMVLLILGDYYLFKTYLANVTSFNLDILIPLTFMGVGIITGIILSAKVCEYFLKHYKTKFLSFILGLIISSSIVLVPINIAYDLSLIITAGLSLIAGGIIVYGLSKIN